MYEVGHGAEPPLREMLELVKGDKDERCRGLIMVFGKRMARYKVRLSVGAGGW